MLLVSSLSKLCKQCFLSMLTPLTYSPSSAEWHKKSTAAKLQCFTAALQEASLLAIKSWIAEVAPEPGPSGFEFVIVDVIFWKGEKWKALLSKLEDLYNIKSSPWSKKLKIDMFSWVCTQKVLQLNLMRIFSASSRLCFLKFLLCILAEFGHPIWSDETSTCQFVGPHHQI